MAGISEEFPLDPLGNVLLRRTSQGADAQNGEMPRFENFHVPNTGRLLFSRKLPPTGTGSTWAPR